MFENKFLRFLVLIIALLIAVYFYYTSDKIKPQMPEKNPLKEVQLVSQEEYMADMNKKIKSNWNKVQLNRDYTIIVSFDIDALGNISNLKILQSSQDEQADKSALEAIINAQPFMSSKALARKDIVNVEFQFDYSASYKE